MKALTLTQPWATLVAIGAKTVETRSWRTDYTGPLAIHAAKTFPPWCRALSEGPVFKEVLERAGFLTWRWLPTGDVVALCQLTGCVRTERLEDFAAIHSRYANQEPFGDFTRGRFAWLLDEVCELSLPIEVKGALGLWEWDYPPVTIKRQQA